MGMDSMELTIEAIRLLLYVAWSDHEIAPEEYDYILRMARNQHLPESEIEAFEAAVRDPTKLTKPNVEVLKPFRNEVLAEVQGLIEADDRVAPAEAEMLHRIATLLS